MKELFRLTLDQGLNRAQPSHTLSPGELEIATGMIYPPGAKGTKKHILYGREQVFDQPSGIGPFGVGYLAFDAPTISDRLIVAGTSGYYTALPESSSSFALGYAVSGIGNYFSMTHYNDVFYICDGANPNLAVSSGLTFRTMGMFAPTNFSLTNLVEYSGLYQRRPQYNAVTNVNGTFFGPDYASLVYSPEFAYDDLLDQSYCEIAPIYIGVTTIYFSGWSPGTTNANTNLFLTVDQTGNTNTNYGASTIKWYDSINGGASWTEFYTGNTNNDISKYVLSRPIPSGINISGYQVKFECNTWDSSLWWAFTGQAKIFYRIWDVVVEGLASGVSTGRVPFDMVSGIGYTFTEYDQERNLESEGWSTPESIQWAASGLYNGITINLPSSFINPTATHYKVYRTVEGGINPSEAGFLALIPSGQTTFVDKFDYDKNTVLTPKYPMVRVLDNTDGTAIYYHRNTNPEPFKQIGVFGPSVIGIDANEPRALWYSAPGYPEYFPSIYKISSFPMKEHDELVTFVGVDRVLIVFAKDGVFTLNGLPYASQNAVFKTAEVIRMAGAPGCVGPRAATEMADHKGNPLAAWIARDGVYITDGYRYKRITDELDWPAVISTGAERAEEFVLHYHKDLRMLLVYYTQSKYNPNYLYLTIHVDQVKLDQNNEGFPKITGAHYGKIGHTTDGVYNGIYNVYSVHPELTTVYKELQRDYARDDSNALSDTGDISYVLKTGKYYNPEYKLWEVQKLVIHHGDFGNNVSGLLTFDYGRDDTGFMDSIYQWVVLEGNKMTEVPVNINCQWFQINLDVEGAGTGAYIESIIGLSAEGGEAGAR